MFSLFTGIVAAAATTTLGAFSEGLVTSLIAYAAVKNGVKGNLTLKKQKVA